MAQEGSYSLTALLLASGGALLSGVLLGYKLAARGSQRGSGKRSASPPNLNLSYLRSVSAEPSSYPGSAWDTPSETPRSGSSENLAGLDAARNAKMAVLVRQDVPMAAGKIVRYVSWTVLGMFKKLYKRRDPMLKLWDVGGQRLDVLLAPSEDELMAVQAKARALGLPTHTFAGRDRSQKQRSVMAVGPADENTLRQVVSHLREL